MTTKSNQNIPTHKFSRKERKKFKEWIDQQIIKKPTPDLLEIYERRILLDHSYLRAEKYDSPEHQQELQDIQKKEQNDKVPRNQQNPNFDKLMELLDNVQSSKSFHQITENLHQLRNFVHQFNFRKHKLNTTYIPNFLNLKKEELDPRLFEQEPEFDNYLNYLLTRFKYQQQEKELEIFLNLSDKKLDDESSKECLEALRDSRTNSEEFLETANQICQALNKPEFKLDNTPINPPFENINQFFNYLLADMT